MKKNVILITSACFALFACDNRDKSPTASIIREENQDQSMVMTSGDDYQTDSDRILLQKIRQALRDDPSLRRSVQAIQIKINNGEVTLKGIVAGRQDKDAITIRVKQISGVRNINNKLETSGRETSYSDSRARSYDYEDEDEEENDEEDEDISPTGTSQGDKFSTNNDRMLLQRIRDLLNQDPALKPESRRILITVDNGNVTIRGTISEERLRTLALNRIKAINGVKTVEHQPQGSVSRNGSPSYYYQRQPTYGSPSGYSPEYNQYGPSRTSYYPNNY